MKPKPVTTSSHDLAPLITELLGLIQSARHAVATTVNTLQVLTNFEIGRRIVEHEQKGAERAEYGKELLKELSARLSEEFGKGFSRTNLQAMRSFFLTWQDHDPRIPLKASRELSYPVTLSWSHYVLLLTVKNPKMLWNLNKDINIV